jgi:lysophospholipase L1-like esterase
MNATKKVFWFVLIFTFIHTSISFLSILFNFSLRDFDNVNILTELFPSAKINQKSIHPELIKDSINVNKVIEQKANFDFSLYKKAKLITNFRTNDSAPSSLPNLMKSLHEIKNGKKRKIRIAYFGDSMIEGDLLTQTLRKLMQKEFGGSGVGFLPLDCVSADFRITARTKNSGWDEYNFKKTNKDLYPSGHVFYSDHGDFTAVNNDVQNPLSIEKSLICGKVMNDNVIFFNNQPINIKSESLVNRIKLSNDDNKTINLKIKDNSIPVYGVSFESESGVIIDNFSYRGISGIELSKIETTLLESLAKNNPYDLIVFQYGVNLLFRPNDVNFNYYERAFNNVLNKFTNAFPNSEFLLISTADRAFRYNGEYKSAIGIDSLVKTQATLAYESGIAFYNQFESMGGKNSIVEWVNQSPSLAGRDYVHPNAKGAEFLANYFFEALMNDYKKYCSKLSK